VPETFPTPPPSNIAVEPDIPVAALPMLLVDPAVPSDTPVEEPDMALGEPKEACAKALPNPEHSVVALDSVAVAGGAGVTPDVSGLTPTEPSSVAPRPTPVGATGAPAPRPSGDVTPSGEGPGAAPFGATCANAEPHVRRPAVIAMIHVRVIVIGRWSLKPGLSHRRVRQRRR
jgi:hypothetical protein